MRRKIIGILICTLFVLSALTSAAYTLNIRDTSSGNNDEGASFRGSLVFI